MDVEEGRRISGEMNSEELVASDGSRRYPFRVSATISKLAWSLFILLACAPVPTMKF